MQILVIDDEPALREILTGAVEKGGHTAHQAAGVAEARLKLLHGDFDVALCDIKMADGDGIDLVREMSGTSVDTVFIIVTAYASLETAIDALRAGAFDYIIKPVRDEEVLNRLSQIETLRGLRGENRALRRQVRERTAAYRFVSPTMVEVERLAGKVARTNSTVLICGESGTGKGILARVIHELSDRSERRFVCINCGAIPEHLMESEFFGHTKGAFTGADRSRKGLLVEADRGTLFLDEISELPIAMQTKLLNVIEDKVVRPVGDELVRNIDVRIIAATNRDLPEMVRQGRFREDLFFRLRVFQIVVPPLRARQADLRPLIRFLVSLHSNHAKGVPLDIHAEAEEMLVAYPWPGNVRELDNVINRACIVAENNCITAADLSSEVIEAYARANENPMRTLLRYRMHQFELEVLHQAVEQAGGDRRLAAQKLGIGLSSLYRKLGEPDRT